MSRGGFSASSALMRSSACSKLGTSAHQPEPSLIPGYRLVHGQLPALQMLDHHLERGKRLFKRPCSPGCRSFPRRRSFRDAIHRDLLCVVNSAVRFRRRFDSLPGGDDSSRVLPGDAKDRQASARCRCCTRAASARLLDRAASTSPEKHALPPPSLVGSGPPHANRGGLDIGSVLS